MLPGSSGCTIQTGLIHSHFVLLIFVTTGRMVNVQLLIKRDIFQQMVTFVTH